MIGRFTIPSAASGLLFGQRTRLFMLALTLACPLAGYAAKPEPLPVAKPFTCSATLCVGFSNDGSAEALVLDTIAQAQRTIRVAIYSFSSKKIAQALLEAKKRGVNVQVFLDRKRAGEGYSSLTFLRNQDFDVRTVDLADDGLMHHKFMVVDDRWVQTGSFNYTKGAAQRNAENVIRTDDKAIVQRYAAEWSRLWALGKKAS